MRAGDGPQRYTKTLAGCETSQPTGHIVNLLLPGLRGFPAPRTNPVHPGTRFVRLYGCMDELLSETSKPEPPLPGPRVVPTRSVLAVSHAVALPHPHPQAFRFWIIIL